MPDGFEVIKFLYEAKIATDKDVAKYVTDNFNNITLEHYPSDKISTH